MSTTERGPSGGVDATFSDVQALGDGTGITLGIKPSELVTHVEYGVHHEDGDFEVMERINVFDGRPPFERAQSIARRERGTVVQRVITVGDWTEVAS